MRNIAKDVIMFGKAMGKIKHELGVSLIILSFIALCLSCLMFISERFANPDYTYADALVWTFVKFVDDPADIVEAPVTVLGQIAGTVVGVVGIAIFAVPAGLIGSGFMDAMAENKRKKELEAFHRKMVRAFPAGAGRALKQYLAKLPDDENAWYKGCQFGYINNNVGIAKFELKGMELKDIISVCKEYPEFRVKNEASAMSVEDGKEDRYMLEYFPVNKRYGYFAKRESKVTIVSTSSQAELCTGNFSYYLAKFAGFNYISKDFNAADGESLYNNHWSEPFYEGVTLQERIDKGEKITKEIKKAYSEKKALREEFLTDLESLCKEEGSWVICLLSQVQNQENTADVHVAHSLADGSCSTILSGKETYDELVSLLNTRLQEELQLSVVETTRYPLVKRGTFKNIAYKLHDDGCKCNVLTLRVSSNLMEFDTRMRVAQFIMAQTIHDVLEPDHRLMESEIKDMNRTSRFYGFADQEVESLKDTIYKEC